jgi:hypothetical protein
MTNVANQLLASSSTAAPTASGTSAPAPEVKGQQAMNEPKDIPESSAQGAKKSKGKPFCYRCHTKGHVLSVCTAVICCDICDGEHITKACPHMKNVQPVATPCGYAVEGLEFYYIPYNGEQKNKKEEKNATVRVKEGSLTVNHLAVELERLLPGKSDWVIEEKGTDAFITTFPSAELLQQLVEWWTMVTKTVKAKFAFEKGADKEVYKYEIPKVWVQFRGLSEEVREFSIIWAIGSILGVTRVVDMKFTKKFGQPRPKVAVLNPELIPDLVDVVIGDSV